MESLGQLTGGIAHDFNNLLQVILGYLDGVKTKGVAGNTAYVEQAVEAMMQVATRGAPPTQQLLAFARRQHLDGRIVNLNTLVAGLIPVMERTPGCTVAIEEKLHPHLLNARIDSTQPELTLLNILINARDAMPEGGRIAVETGNRTIGEEDCKHFDDAAPECRVDLARRDGRHRKRLGGDVRVDVGREDGRLGRRRGHGRSGPAAPGGDAFSVAITARRVRAGMACGSGATDNE